MLKQLHQESNRNPNSVRFKLVISRRLVAEVLTLAFNSPSQRFVDPILGEIGASDSPSSNNIFRSSSFGRMSADLPTLPPSYLLPLHSLSPPCFHLSSSPATIDARTGKPISHLKGGSRTPSEYSDGYGMYGSLSEEVARALDKNRVVRRTQVVPGTRIATVEL